VNEDIFGKNSSEAWPKMAPQDIEFAAQCQADDQKCAVLEGMYKYANIQDRRDEVVTKRLTDCKRKLHHLMVGALNGQPRALEGLIFESRFDTNRFQYEIDLNQCHIEAISKEMNQVQNLVYGIISSPGL
jgi:hypothetical protein